jgi:hypothetical protein
VNVAEAEFALVSVAATLWIPAVVAGRAQALKLPVASVVQDVGTLLPSTAKVILSFRAKPVPLTAVLPPTPPVLEMAGLTVKVEVVVPASVPSDTVTVPGPAGAAGTLNVQALKAPLPLAVQDVGTLLPLKLMVMGANGAKPLPLTAAVLPTMPALESRLMTGLTVYVAEAEFALVSVAVTV